MGECLLSRRASRSSGVSRAKAGGTGWEPRPTAARPEGGARANVATTHIKCVRISRPLRAKHLFGWFSGLKPRLNPIAPKGLTPSEQKPSQILSQLRAILVGPRDICRRNGVHPALETLGIPVERSAKTRHSRAKSLSSIPMASRWEAGVRLRNRA
jgi:hypothetical protein